MTIRIRYRVRFEKRDLLRWIGHNDLARLWERIVRRAQLKPSMTEGFHPKPRIAFPSALALGIEGLDEVLDIDLAEELPPDDLFRRLADDHQPGLVIKHVCRLPEGIKKAQLKRSDYVIALPPSMTSDSDLDAIRAAVAELKSRETVSVERKKKQVVANVANDIPQLELEDGHLVLSLTATPGASLKPNDILQILGFDDWINGGAIISRTRVVLEEEHT
ncbi:hypothetical protein Q31b_55070 [Novipirellula aureliae]|uniref:DUF2344 domain-containing protein n=1 Tax=Novipirellula aureliae TaxID=2527966 RepID=A0A5C6DBJ4_9BACT|nr:TIGR03936 family radical SAM-associated protein [Novipirellula aureliae]TWU34553.1 hypothetical protein Q31b_55070 [Novipirellula aureliae]